MIQLYNCCNGCDGDGDGDGGGGGWWVVGGGWWVVGGGWWVVVSGGGREGEIPEFHPALQYQCGRLDSRAAMRAHAPSRAQQHPWPRQEHGIH